MPLLRAGDRLLRACSHPDIMGSSIEQELAGRWAVHATGGRPIKVANFFPHVEREMAGRTPDWGDVLAVDETAGATGFDSFWLPDHLLFCPDREEPQGQWECWTLLAVRAARTSRIALGPLLSCF